MKTHRDGDHEQARTFLNIALKAAPPEFRVKIEKYYKPLFEKQEPFQLEKGLMIHDYLLIGKWGEIEGLGAWEF